MELSTNILGAGTVSYIRRGQTTAVLLIGNDGYTRAKLAEYGCFNFHAAANLSKILHRELNVKNTADLFDHVSPAMLALPHLGAVSLAVLGAAFEIKGLGGSAPLEGWVKSHQPDAPLVTFASMKHREEEERAKARKALRRRKAARRNKAHEIRVDRFEAKAGQL